MMQGREEGTQEMSTPTIEAAWRDRAALAQPTLSNGLTEAETSATASVMGLTHDSEYVARFGRVTLSGPREDVEFAVRHLPDVDDGAQQPATPEPVYQIRKAFTQDAEWAWRDATEAVFHMHPEDHRRILYTHPVPIVPADVVRDEIASVREHYRGTDWGKAAECVCDAIDAAMLAAKDASA